MRERRFSWFGQVSIKASFLPFLHTNRTLFPEAMAGQGRLLPRDMMQVALGNNGAEHSWVNVTFGDASTPVDLMSLTVKQLG